MSIWPRVWGQGQADCPVGSGSVSRCGPGTWSPPWGTPRPSWTPSSGHWCLGQQLKRLQFKIQYYMYFSISIYYSMNEAVHLVILVTPKKSACLGESIKLTQKKKSRTITPFTLITVILFMKMDQNIYKLLFWMKLLYLKVSQQWVGLDANI